MEDKNLAVTNNLKFAMGELLFDKIQVLTENEFLRQEIVKLSLLVPKEDKDEDN